MIGIERWPLRVYIGVSTPGTCVIQVVWWAINFDRLKTLFRNIMGIDRNKQISSTERKHTIVVLWCDSATVALQKFGWTCAGCSFCHEFWREPLCLL